MLTDRICMNTQIRDKANIKEWGTYVFNYGRYEVSNFLIKQCLVLA